MILLLVIFSLIVLFELPGLIYDKYWPEAAAFLILLGAGFILSVLLVLDIGVPSPTVIVTKLVELVWN